MELRTIFAAGIAALMTAGVASAEPFGQGFDGWVFTQDPKDNGGVACRATLGDVRMAKSTDGEIYVSTRSPLAEGRYPDATVFVGGNAEMVRASSRNGRLSFFVDEYVLQEIAVNRGYEWNVAVGTGIESGFVEFNDSAVSALEVIMECVAANGG